MPEPPLRPIDDVLDNGVRLLLVGINPGVRSAQRNRHFAGPSNRFWPALHAAGLTPERVGPDRQHELPGLGIGITNLVARPSARADEVTAEELLDGGRRIIELVAALEVPVVAVLGVTAFRLAFARPRAPRGEQPERWGGARWFVLHNPSGLNAHARPADHARGLREAGVAADLLPATGPPAAPPHRDARG